MKQEVKEALEEYDKKKEEERMELITKTVSVILYSLVAFGMLYIIHTLFFKC